MVHDEDYITPADILSIVPGLTREKLMYWAGKGYLEVVKEKRGSLDYTFFKRDQLPLIKKAHQLINIDGMKPKTAFERLAGEYNSQLLFSLK